MPYVRRVTAAYLCAALLASIGCDPGYDYKPLDAGGRKVAKWSDSVSGVRFEMKPFMILTGSGGTSQGLTIVNGSDRNVVVLGGQLSTNGRTLEAKLPGEGEVKWRTVPPGAAETINLSWDFGEQGGYADKALGPSVTWIWRVKIGDEEHTIRVGMERN
jgi:hypothetical protein